MCIYIYVPININIHIDTKTCGQTLQSIVGPDYLASESARRRMTSCNRRAPQAT